MPRQAARIFDEYLVAAAKSGDRDAFAHLARRWDRKLFAHAWRLTGDREAARDAVQNGWAEIVRGLGSLRDERAFPAWAYRIVSRACARHINRAIRRRDLAHSLEQNPAADAEVVEDGAEAEALRSAIAALPREQRAAIALFHLQELSIAEVAVALDVPAGTVKTRLMHARRKLRDTLAGECP